MMKRTQGAARRLFCLLSVLCMCVPTFAAAASMPYDSYNYDYWGDITFTPAPYAPAGSVSGVALGVGAFNAPQDVAVAPDGAVYIADTGNNRIVAANAAMTKASVIDGFTDENGVWQSFLQPYGVAVSEKEQLYIADTGNNRIVVLNKDLSFVRYVKDPQSEVLAADYVFNPLKLSVDYADRVYCTARNVFQGIMVFNEEGSFNGFYGTIAVTLSPWQKFWRRFSTKEQRARQQLYIPTEFTGVDVDSKGFIYASNVDPQGTQAVRRLNPKGEDVIVMSVSQNLGGDLQVPAGTGQYSGPSVIVDVAVRGQGVYSLLDSKRGRIFTYDNEGNLLYIFGGLGNQTGTFRTPAAIAYSGRKILVLDSIRNELMLFSETEYGRLINEAVGLRYDGDEALAVAMWHEVLKLNENLELANTGIGKAYLTAGDNEQAMKYLKLGMNRAYYSTAFKRYRNEILKENLGLVLTIALVLTAGLLIWSFLSKRGKPRQRGLLDGD